MKPWMREFGRWLVLAWALASIVLGAALAFAETAVTVSWDPPTTDPIELSDIAGYRIRWRVDGSPTYLVTDVGLVTTVRLTGLPEAKVFITGQTVDRFGQESPWTGETAAATKPAIPKTMGGLRVTKVELVRP